MEKQQTVQRELASLQTQIEKTRLVRQLAEAKAGGLDREMQLLKEHARISRSGGSSKGILSALGLSEDPRQREVDAKTLELRKQRELIGEAIADLNEEHAALEHQRRLHATREDLLEAELALRRHRLQVEFREYVRSVIPPLATVVFIVLFYLLLSRIVLPRAMERQRLFVLRRIGSHAVAFLIVAILVFSFLEDLRAIATFMGILGAAVVIALQDLCSSFAGWFVIVSSGKVRVGDRVEIGDCRGDVVDIQMLRTTLLEVNSWLGVDDFTGRTVIIPNSFIFRERVYNYSRVDPYVWNKLELTVTYETPFREAYDLLMGILMEECREAVDALRACALRHETVFGRQNIFSEPRIHTLIADSGVLFSLYYVSHYRQVTATRDRLGHRILEAFQASPTINFAYPTERHIPTPVPRPRPEHA